MQKQRASWRLDEWCDHFAKVPTKPMTEEEIEAAIKFLRDFNYPVPEDCPGPACPEWRPACKLGICKIAVEMCGDF